MGLHPLVMNRPTVLVRIFTSSLVTFALVMLTSNVAPGRAAPPTFATSFAIAEPIELAGNGGSYSRSISFNLPSDAKQGKDRWYILQSVLEIDAAGSLPTSEIANYVQVSTNGYAAALIKFKPVNTPTGSSVEWSTTELFTGPSRGRVLSQSFRLEFRNYLQLQGILGGTNTLTLTIDQSNGIVVKAARLLPGSLIASTAMQPPDIEIERAPSVINTRAGEGGTIDFTVAGSGLPAWDVQLGLEAKGPIILAPPMLSYWDMLAGKERVSLTFWGIHSGEALLTIRVKGANAGDAIRIPIRIR
jgi:hypothetical protein